MPVRLPRIIEKLRKFQKRYPIRIWATQRLRDYLVNGYALNQQRFQQNAAELEQALELIRKAAQSPELRTVEGRGLVEIISRYTHRLSSGCKDTTKVCWTTPKAILVGICQHRMLRCEHWENLITN
jgi:hypothetical protein